MLSSLKGFNTLSSLRIKKLKLTCFKTIFYYDIGIKKNYITLLLCCIIVYYCYNYYNRALSTQSLPLNNKSVYMTKVLSCIIEVLRLKQMVALKYL